MDLSIQKLSKAFNQKIVFQDLSFEVNTGAHFAITGSNGSGKSTLLKILSGGTLPSSGNIQYMHNSIVIPETQVFRYVHFVAPYNTVIEELSMHELFRLHQQLGLLRAYRNFQSWYARLNFTFNADQQIKSFSSGMKQRLRLGLVLLDDRPLILLDEPTSNLDEQGKNWFVDLVGKLAPEQTLIIASNDPMEISLCGHRIRLERSA